MFISHHTFKITRASFSLLILFLISVSGFAQSPSSQIRKESLNKPFLEHLIKSKVDSLRLVNNCKSLANDSLLQVAANHHSAYMSEYARMTHQETEFPHTKTPQNRAEYFGAKNYFVGENVAKISRVESSYEQLANAILIPI